jgi:uracil-DNA glycosylase
MEEQQYEIYEKCEKCYKCGIFSKDDQDNRAITCPRDERECKAQPCEIMFVGQAPSWSEYGFSKKKLRKKRPVLHPSEGSRAAVLLGDAFKELRFDSKKAYFTNLVKCTSIASKKEGCPTNCFYFLQQEILMARPKKVVAFGKQVNIFLERNRIKSKSALSSFLWFAWR